MSVKFSLKSLFFTLLGSLACSVGAAFLVNFLLSGPELGPHYDFLLNLRSPPPVSREILIINTDEFVNSGDISLSLTTLTEMEAANLILAGRILPSSSPITVSETEIRNRFLDEYILLGSNIRNLFEAIRSGSVSPMQAPGYVERLVELTEEGRDRLLTALIDGDEDLLRSIAVFGNYLEINAKPVFDKDGKLRRVRPVDPETSEEHPVFLSLKHRYAASQIETTDQGNILWLRGHDGNELDIPLDKKGSIITAWNCTFRRIDISLFREYDEADRVMRNALVRADELGAFSQTMPENSPLVLGDYALMLRDEMFDSPDNEKRAAWIQARAGYFRILAEFLDSPAETIIVRGYENVIADETSLNEEGLAALFGMRDELRQSFTVMREEHRKLAAIRSKLEEELFSSFCLMGTEENTEYSALLANVLITTSHIIPAYDRAILFWTISAAFVILLIIFLMQPAILLIFGFCLSVIAAAASGYVFVFYSYWLDPVIVFSSSFCGTLVLFYCKRAIINYRTRCFRAAYGAAVSPDVLKELICHGRPHLTDVIVASAAVIAIKDINLLNREDREKPRDAGKLKKMFFSSVKKSVYDSGAVIAGFEGDTVLVCFGSPLDKSRERIHDPLTRACALVRELLGNEKISWRFGIDAGECTFSWLPETGYSVNGRPAVRARILVSKTVRLKARALITDHVREKINADIKKIDSLYDDSESIYPFPV
jgi:hypothetical protein